VKETTIGSFTELTDACIEALHARSQPDGNSDAQAKGNQLAAGAL